MKVQPITITKKAMNISQSITTDNLYQLSPWFNEIEAISGHDIEEQVSLLSQRYSESNKWVLVISRDSSAFGDFYKSRTNQLHHCSDHHSASQQTQSNVKPKNVLWVHANKVNVAHANIEKSLTKGNCAAVVLINAQLNTFQQDRLRELAQQGKTQCVLLSH